MPSGTPVRGMFRTAAKYLTEPHPFGRNPITQAPHAVPWGVYYRRLGRTSAYVFPMAALILGWPLAGYAYFNKIGL